MTRRTYEPSSRVAAGGHQGGAAPLSKSAELIGSVLEKLSEIQKSLEKIQAEDDRRNRKVMMK